MHLTGTVRLGCTDCHAVERMRVAAGTTQTSAEYAQARMKPIRSRVIHKRVFVR